MRSIERSLLAWILGALVLGSILLALVTYLVTLEEINEVFDADLKNIAQAMASYHDSGFATNDGAPLQLPQRHDVPEDSEIVTLTWNWDGQRIYASDPRVKVPFSDEEGLSRQAVEGEPWIIYTSARVDGIAQAAQRVASREEMAGEAATKVFPPMLFLVVVIGALLMFGLRRGLQPLDAAARDIAARSATALDPLVTGDVPREIAPLVSSINDLIERLSVAFSAQRSFLADAAHELRTPVTALRLQLQLLRRSKDEASREQAMAVLESGINRSQRLIEQLLQVARIDPDGEATRRDHVALDDLVRAVVTSMSVRADQRGIDLGAGGPSHIVVQGDAEQLTVLLNNLVENALRYTPQGGVVDVEACRSGDRATLRVIDNGFGIPESEHVRVFKRFYRCDHTATRAADAGGSGLGLAIVQTIADRHDAIVSLHTPDSGRGLEVRIVFAPADPQPVCS